MYAALGDRQKQDEIRRETSEADHCEFLLQTPNACIGCDFNPLGDEDAIPPDDIDSFGLDLLRAIRLYNLVEAGITLPADKITCYEADRLVVLRGVMKEQEVKRAKKREKPPLQIAREREQAKRGTLRG